ncbi:MAG: phytanoyl-CoA dioxygenase family protein [Hyphomicrobiales bacterium]|nr:phytanoyl-CoA dioxygenase family protein [Hyphomicrobiales bacterium]
MHAPQPATTPIIDLPPATETGALGVCQLKRLWTRNAAARAGHQLPVGEREKHLDHLVIDALGIGLEQTMQHLFGAAPTYEQFERWIVETAGPIDPLQAARINAAVTGAPYPAEITQWLAAVDASAPVLSPDDLAFWDEHGYVILHDAVPADSLAAAAQAVWDHVGARPDDPETWYRQRNNGIMVQYFQHPAFNANRRSPRIHKAFAQLWGTADLWVSTDRVGFNVPERPGRPFPGPDLHWDTSLVQPMPFHAQGILYLTDTPPEQGAFTCVPGFHRRISTWLANLPADSDPRQQDLHALGSQPIGGCAGDLIIWNDALPHGSRPNRGRAPRVVQYIRMYPTRMDVQEVWK